MLIIILLVGLNSGDKQTNAEQSLYRYANYIFYGVEESTHPEMMPAYYNTELYTIAENGDLISFVQHASDLFQNFVDEYSSNPIKTDDETTNLINDTIGFTRSGLDALLEYYSTGNVDVVRMIALYFEDGSAKMQEYVAAVYNNMLSNDNSLLVALARNHIVMADRIGLVYDAYSELDCIQGGEIVPSCSESILQDNDELVVAINTFSALDLDNTQINRQLLSNVIGNCWNMIITLNRNTETR